MFVPGISGTSWRGTYVAVAATVALSLLKKRTRPAPMRVSSPVQPSRRPGEYGSRYSLGGVQRRLYGAGVIGTSVARGAAAVGPTKVPSPVPASAIPDALLRFLTNQRCTAVTAGTPCPRCRYRGLNDRHPPRGAE